MDETLVGRDDALRTLRDVVSRGRRAATGVIVTGDAGMGKTALLRTAIDAAEPDVRVLNADGIEVASNYVFAGLQQLLAPVLPVPDDAISTRHREVLDSALGTGVPVALDDYAVAASVLALFAHLTQDGPVLIGLDDLQWLDRGSLTALAFAVRRLADHPITVVAACRSDALAGLEFLDVPQIALAPLDAQSARMLLHHTASERRAPLGDAELDGLVQLGGGIPLALVELSSLPSLAPAGHPSNPAGEPVRRLIDRLFGRRVAALSTAASTAALLAALDEPTEHDAFVRAGSELGVTSADWAEAERAGVLRLDLGRIDVSHPLLRRAVLDAATPQDVRGAHAALAAALLDRGDTARALTHRSAASVGRTRNSPASWRGRPGLSRPRRAPGGGERVRRRVPAVRDRRPAGEADPARR